MAVIFDVDGVLVDSYRAHYESWTEVAADDGIPFTEADFAASFGMTSDEVIRRHWGTPDAPPSIQTTRRIDAIKEQRYRDIVDRAFPPIPGAVALIDALHAADVPLAVGSSGPPENVGLVLDRLERRDRFAAVISRADVTHGKPAPDIFALAATRLGVPADRCVVIEDAPPGVEAARAAGMHVVALLSNGRRRDEFAAHMPDRFVTSLEDLDPEQLATLVTD
jgi:beta-phosphoglucomutase